ncbi:MAG: transposase [Candidatus Yanofskybacteria bacterium]|nr:transposase [Candidatus Yanofskybacteria bacterium]
MKKPQFVTGEFYHIYNRGNNKRPIFLKPFNMLRFLEGMIEFNVRGPIGSIYAKSFEKDDQLSGSTTKLVKLVDFICYCLNPNHFHLLVRQLEDGGIVELMHKIGTGYTRYFNEKYKFSGALFQGRYKAIQIDTNDYLLYLSAYINLNPEAHQLSGSTTKLWLSSWDEYSGDKLSRNRLCSTEFVLSQFKTREDYKKFAKEALAVIREKKEMQESLKLLLSG